MTGPEQVVTFTPAGPELVGRCGIRAGDGSYGLGGDMGLSRGQVFRRMRAAGWTGAEIDAQCQMARRAAG